VGGGGCVAWGLRLSAAQSVSVDGGCGVNQKLHFWKSSITLIHTKPAKKEQSNRDMLLVPTHNSARLLGRHAQMDDDEDLELLHDACEGGDVAMVAAMHADAAGPGLNE
jgi:hypothetical protein